MNHGFFTTRKLLTGDRLYADLQSVIAARFGAALTVRRDNDTWFGIVRTVDQNDWHFSWSIWLETRRKVEYRHSLNDFAMWTQAFVTESLAARYDAMLRDEGISDVWKPRPERFRTLRQYVDVVTCSLPGMRHWAVVTTRFAAIRSDLPDDLRAVISRPPKGATS
jgi:hypothetical protein